MFMLLMVAIGGALGASCRYLLGEVCYVWFGRSFPVGILTANILGSFLMGLFAIMIVHKFHLSEAWRLLALVGFLGGFTTFSSFSLDVVNMFQDELYTKALTYILVSVVFSILATALGIYLAQKAL